jgi:hypothetical protein
VKKLNRYLLVVLFCAAVAVAVSAQVSSQPATNTPAIPHPEWLDHVSLYATVFGAVLTGLGTLFGLPLVILNFKKTRAEIRKLELEATALERTGQSIVGDVEGGVSLTVSNSSHVNVQVLADPRFLGPLLLLLDFILAWIVLTFADYFIGIVTSVIHIAGIGMLILLAIACVLLIPIAKEARRVRSVLRPKTDETAGESEVQSKS